jgi:hypothetical protein
MRPILTKGSGVLYTIGVTDQASIYIIGPEGGPFKIGWSADPQSRLTNIQVGQALTVQLWYHEPVEASLAPVIEKLIHKQIGHQRIRGEWFNLSLEEAKAEVQYGVVRWSQEPNLVFRFKKRLL